MTTKTNGNAAFLANIAAMKQRGIENAARRAQEAKERQEAHLSTMSARAIEAGVARAVRSCNGVSKRNSHNERLAADRAARMEYRNGLKIGGAT